MGSVKIKIISVVGKKDTGKTSLTVKIIKELRKRSFKVATIKHSHHMLEMDRENTDTWKHKEAGSETVVGIGSRTFFNINKDLSLERLLFLIKLIDEPDFVVVEGFKNYNYAKISTSKEINDEFTLKNVDALNIKDSEIPKLVDLIENYSYDILDTLYIDNCGLNDAESIGKAIISQSQERKDNEKENIKENKEENKEENEKKEIQKQLKELEVEDVEVLLSINEKVIGVNSFVSSFMKNSILGMLNSLKTEEYGIKDFDKVELVINNGNKK
ncbi:molybdopterin-guanine dinucleotide biosynthesis protein B [Methanobrevibacter arboriphilus JCM 13429 = DSM 1125]|uniref:Molybdopterin-guanine dinucleotide biosynthesis protein B n=2 Tax=Methanobrevibacter arboriphilus TaxID=39441 RepID=A0A1V6N4J7_METAZ|nr:molybdopterin-guanine dinucleotide biosynthesis protein B [Methanobrevibacter arboriphilus]OQD59503.1 molybdopterin-guanine dinucleotide biosynthesis protein B [Methanobrevibacter arboriphilus JCM 13429 = DSM 1125]